MLHPNMMISEGETTQARLAKRHGAEISNGLCLIDHWVAKTCEKLQTLSSDDERFGARLFYEDALFEDLMLRLNRKSPEQGGHTDLVLARIGFVKSKKGKGHFSTLRTHLEKLAGTIGARFIVEAANPYLGGHLRATGNYVHFVHGGDPLEILLKRPSHSWIYEPTQALGEISWLVPMECIRDIRKTIVHGAPHQVEEIREAIGAFIKRISASSNVSEHERS